MLGTGAWRRDSTAGPLRKVVTNGIMTSIAKIGRRQYPQIIAEIQGHQFHEAPLVHQKYSISDVSVSRSKKNDSIESIALSGNIR